MFQKEQISSCLQDTIIRSLEAKLRDELRVCNEKLRGCEQVRRDVGNSNKKKQLVTSIYEKMNEIHGCLMWHLCDMMFFFAFAR